MFIYHDNRPTSFHKYILDNNSKWDLDTEPYKKVDHLLFGYNINVYSLQTLCSYNNTIYRCIRVIY